MSINQTHLDRVIESLEGLSRDDLKQLRLEAQRAGVDLWPGDRITYQRHPGTVRRITIESRLEFHPEPTKNGALGYTAQKRSQVYYFLTLDNGEHPSFVSRDELEKSTACMKLEHTNELIRCAQNVRQTIRPENRSRQLIALALMCEGYLIPVYRRNDPTFQPDLLSNVYGVTLTLTEKGKTYILALSPEEFDNIGQLWPRAVDVRQAQERISADSG